MGLTNQEKLSKLKKDLEEASGRWQVMQHQESDCTFGQDSTGRICLIELFGTLEAVEDLQLLGGNFDSKLQLILVYFIYLVKCLFSYLFPIPFMWFGSCVHGTASAEFTGG